MEAYSEPSMDDYSPFFDSDECVRISPQDELQMELSGVQRESPDYENDETAIVLETTADCIRINEHTSDGRQQSTLLI